MDFKEDYQEEKTLNVFSFDATKWEEVKKNLYYRFVNEKVVPQYGDNIPYIKYMDLAKTITVREKINETVHSHFLTEKDMEKYNVTWEQVVACTNINERTIKDGRVCLLSDFIVRCNSSMFPLVNIPKTSAIGVNDREFIRDQDEDGNPNVLVSYSRKMAFGASYGFSADALMDVYKKFGREDFYVLPMSIHNLFFIKESYANKNGKKTMVNTEEDLSDMLSACNDNIKSWKDILSYNVYKFSAGDGGRLMVVTK